jgi:hypothetical protein
MLRLIAILCLAPAWAFSQNIDRGPVVGGVTDTSARIYIRTTLPQQFELEYSTDSTFATLFSRSVSTDSAGYLARITDLDSLQAATKYWYRFNFGDLVDSVAGSFKTFPVPGTKGHYKIIVASCNYNDNDPIFESVRAFEPDVFLHLGDWDWPPNPLGNDYNLFPDRRAESFARRYNGRMMRTYILPFTPIAYTYDDDYSFNNSEGYTYPLDRVDVVNGEVFNRFITVPMDSGIRRGAIEAYHDYFPGYPMQDSVHGIYHEFTLGNIEIFMTDCRMNLDPKFDAFVYDSVANTWSFSPPPGHSMLGDTQRQWLMDGLENSGADWKLIGSGVVFNQQYKRILDVGLLLQQLQFTFGGVAGSGGTLAAQMAYNWIGYPEDQQPLIDGYQNGTIKDILFMSGDSHSSVMDDGTNAGIPEVNSSGLAAGDEGFLNYYIDSVGAFLGYPPVADSMWNGGGNGVGNRNFSDTYAQIEVFGDDSLRVCVVDEMDQTLGCMTLIHSSKKPTGIETVFAKSDAYLTIIFPNPAKDQIRLVLSDSYTPQASDYVTMTDLNGKQVQRFSQKQLNGMGYVIQLEELAQGTYLLHYHSATKGVETRKVLVMKY